MELLSDCCVSIYTQTKQSSFRLKEIIDMDTPKTISRNDLREMLEGDVEMTLIEVLSPESFAEFHLPGAVNIPGDQLRQRIAEVVPDRDRTVVVYCANPSCAASDRAADLLVEMGYNDVRDYRGGKEHWKEGGLEVETEQHAMA